MKTEGFLGEKARNIFSYRRLIEDLNDAIFYKNKNTDLTKVFKGISEKFMLRWKEDGKIGLMIYNKYPGVFRATLFPAYKDIGKELFLDFFVRQMANEIPIRRIANNVEREHFWFIKTREEKK